MSTYCPSCGMNQPTEERIAGTRKQWRCATCGLVFKEEPVPEQVLGRIPVQRLSPAELRAAAERAAAEKLAAAVAAAAAAKARAPADGPAPGAKPRPTTPEKPAAGAKPAAPAEKAAAPIPSWQNGEGLEIAGMPTGEFVIEMNGQELVAGKPRAPSAKAAPAPAPAPAASAQAPDHAIEIPGGMTGEFVIEMNGQEIVAGKPRAPAPAPALAPAHSAAPAPAAEAAPSSTPAAMFHRVVVAEDTALLREVLKDALVQNGVSQQVRGCANGEEFLQACAETLSGDAHLDLAVLDVEMPVLGGYQAAIALRAVERGLRAPPTPIVFFTAYACDDTFRKVLDHCQPARYLNKGADASPPRIAARLVQVLGSLKR